LIEIPAILISILAFSILINSVAFDAFLALSLLDVVAQAVRVLDNTNIFVVEDKTFNTTDTCSILVGITIFNFASIILSQLERIIADRAAPIN
jgi:hypothetical protein